MRVDDPWLGRPIKTFTYASANGASNWKNGKLEQASRFHHVFLAGTPYTVEVKETYTYGGRGGRASVRVTESLINGGVADAFTQTWTYTPLGDVGTMDYPRCTTCSIPAPRTVSFGYRNGRLSSAAGYTGTVSGQPAGVGVSYHPNGMVHRVAHANGVTWTQAADPAGMRRPGSISTAGAINPNDTNADWSTGSYAFDGTGNVVGIGTSWFLYDPVSRLVSSTQFDGLTGGGAQKVQSYSYDAFGNIQAIGGTSGRATPTDPATNHLVHGIYDQTGRLRIWSDHYYDIDPLGQVSGIEAGAEKWFHFYTADEERLWSFQYGGGTRNRWTLRDLDGKVLREYGYERLTATWAVERDYVYRGSTLLAADTPNGRIHYHPDHLGTPRPVTNSARHKIAYHVYYPFGEEATAFNQDTERMKFTGHERDLHNPAGPGDDLDYMHARYCSPVTGRFLSVDPVGGLPEKPQSWNRFAYVRNNPLGYTDPLGLFLIAMTDEARADICQLVGENCSNHLTFADDGAVTVTATEAELASNEALALFHDLATSEYTFGAYVGNSLEYQGGTLRLGPSKGEYSAANLSIIPDVRLKTQRLPPLGYSGVAAVAADFDSVTTGAEGKPVHRPSALFHELAETYYRTAKHQQYRVAHPAAIAREDVLRSQRPDLQGFTMGWGPYRRTLR